MWSGLESGAVLQAPPRLAIYVMTLIIKVNTFMGRPPGQVQSTPFQMRASPEFLKSVDKWRAKQEDKPSRAEAIRRLVELGLTVKASARPVSKPGRRLRAQDLAKTAIDKMSDPSASPEERNQRRRRLTKGPSEFRDERVDQPKAKAK